MSRKRIAWGVALILLAMFAGAAWLSAHYGGPRSAYNEVAMLAWPDRFSPSDWRSHPGQRWKMADDLVRQTTLRGKSRAEVMQMLGAATPGLGGPNGMTWVTPAPERPDDRLVIEFRDGVVD